MGRKSFKSKDPWAGLSGEFRGSVDAADDDKVREAISKAAMELVAMKEAKGLDVDLKAKQDEAREAGKVYAEVDKTCKLKIKYCRQILESRGRDVPSASDWKGGSPE